MLAVSGGLDSMVLLQAASRMEPQSRSDLTVASFDHGTGSYAKQSTALVARECRRLRIPCTIGRCDGPATSEAEWRKARWEFLLSAAAIEGRAVATAHNLDDQVETVVMRIMRDAGPRGLAGLFADSSVIRPLLGTSRGDIRLYAETRRVRFREDPSNSDRAHLRNRIRHDILPALVRAHPELPAQLLDVAGESASWRSGVERVVDTLGADLELSGALRVARASLRGYDAPSLRVLWPALAARARVIMDRRGTHRAAEFTINGMTGGSIQLSGGVEILMRREHMLLRRWRSAPAVA